ncbi:hypothetical protein ACNO8X_14925 [Mycobacterium sp. PDNC021]|uniref:hypothetical protein n=1 Tax=Mycobacterium sp. PDNC021 TaxID=3391399 RepID=UPI003AAF5C5B
MFTVVLGTALATAFGAVLLSSPVLADDGGSDGADPAIGQACMTVNLNDTAKSPSGDTLRCLATGSGGFSWMTDTGAAGTIAQLEKEGYGVQLERVGVAPMDKCTVQNVWDPIIQTRTDRSTGSTHATTIVINKTIRVSLDCTG